MDDRWPKKEYPLGHGSNIEFKQDGLFHLHRNYEKKKDTETVYCAKCHGNQFHVGCGDYITFIKCVVCGWEEYIQVE